MQIIANYIINLFVVFLCSEQYLHQFKIFRSNPKKNIISFYLCPTRKNLGRIWDTPSRVCPALGHSGLDKKSLYFIIWSKWVPMWLWWTVFVKYEFVDSNFRRIYTITWWSVFTKANVGKSKNKTNIYYKYYHTSTCSSVTSHIFILQFSIHLRTVGFLTLLGSILF